MSKIIVAIDGYSGCGKSTTAKIVAERLNYIYIDSGAMYRAITLHFQRENIPLNNNDLIAEIVAHLEIGFAYNPYTHKSETYLNGENVEHLIRTMHVSDQVSEVSKIPIVRHAMVALQQKMGQQKGIVMDGRDIGTRVFPEAELKIFMHANLEIRATRRQAELFDKGEHTELQDIIQNLAKRDQIDTSRVESPLRQADDALALDSSNITIAQQTEYVINLAHKVIEQENQQVVFA